jgi:hypothetical protein
MYFEKRTIEDYISNIKYPKLNSHLNWFQAKKTINYTNLA